MGKEQECVRGSDVGRIFASELHELVVKGRPHFHREASLDVLDQGLCEGNAVEVLHVVELLDDLWSNYLGRQIFSNFLNRFITGKEVKNLTDI